MRSPLGPALAVAALVVMPALSLADATYQPLPFLQNWSNTTQIGVADNWSLVPGVIGYRGDNLTAGADVDPQTVLGDDSPGVVDVNPNQTNPLTFTTGGIAEFEFADPVVAMNGSSTADAPYLTVHVNASGQTGVTVSCRLRDLENSPGTDNATMRVAVHFRTAGAGMWTNVPAAYVPDASVPPTQSLTLWVYAPLPPAADNAASLQIRFMTTNATGNDEWIGVDDIEVTGGAPFTDVTAAPMSLVRGLGAAWTDYDNDGDPDLYAVRPDPELDRLIGNDGGGAFSTISGPFEVPGNLTARWGDFDNDGDPDLFVPGYGTGFGGPGDKLFRNNGGGAFTNVTSSPFESVPVHNSTGAAWGDFDNDGDLDLFVVDDFAPHRMLRNDGAGNFSDVTSAPLGGTGASGVAAADYDADGDLDLFVLNNGAANQLFRNEGGGSFTDVTSGPLAGGGNSIGAAWGDYDNDGDLDLAVGSVDAPDQLLRNNGGGTFVNVASASLASCDAFGMAWADSDHDGDLDLYVANNGGVAVGARYFYQGNKLMRNDGAGVFVPTRGAIGDSSVGHGGTAWVDYDLDGDPDVFVTRLLIGTPEVGDKLYRNDQSTGNHWLHVRLAGTTSNAAGIGARVRVRSAGTAQIREISGGAGYAQGPATAEFGLGASTTIDSLVVRWPSGIVQAVIPVPTVDRRVTVTEGTTASAPDPASRALSFSIGPNPLRELSVIRFTLSHDARVRIELFEIDGRRAAVLSDQQRTAGLHQIRFSRGRLGAGLYFCRMTAGALTRTEKIVLTP